MYITRIAPSPTGMFHIGTARTAYFNWLAARASGGKFILRIDDTDVDRNREDATDVIIHSLQWLGLDWDELQYQSQRIDYYQQIARDFVTCGAARRLDNGAIALILPDCLPGSFDDTIAGKIAITESNRNQIDGMILVRGDGGGPTYQFCSMLDDIDMGVNWIIRGHDHITNTPKQIAIWWAYMGERMGSRREMPQFSHVGLIHKDGKKLSKRDDAASLLTYRERGYHPEAILSYVLRMGWGPRNEDKSHKVITRERALELFLTGGSMRASPANYDQARLDMIQANYERMLKIPHHQWVKNRPS